MGMLLTPSLRLHTGNSSSARMMKRLWNLLVIATGVDMATTVDLLEEVFKEKGLGRYQMPAKIGLYPDDSSYLHAMPCHLKQRNIMGLKWVTGFNYNRRDYGLPMIMGLFIYNDPHTGAPLAIMDSAWITTHRRFLWNEPTGTGEPG